MTKPAFIVSAGLNTTHVAVPLIFTYLFLTFIITLILAIVLAARKSEPILNLANYPYEYVTSTCIPAKGMESLVRDLKNTKWNVRGTQGERIGYDDINATCDCQDRKGKVMKRLAPFVDTSFAHIYHSCFRNNFSSIRRQCAMVLQPTEAVLNQFRAWYKSVFDAEIVPLLEQVNVDQAQWINHLETKKQGEVLPYFNHPKNTLYNHEIGLDDVPEMNVYNNFVKSEKQFSPLKDEQETEGDYSKTRCICSPGAKYKYVMGPVVLELERIFKKEFFGYVTPSNWQEYEKLYDHLDSVGFDQTLQIDGSGFDMTQHQEIKEVVDHSIYKWLVENGKITHVDEDVFRAVALSCWRTIKLSAIVNKKYVSYGSVVVRGRVFSGSMDTTFMNTLRMTLYNRFVMEDILNYTPKVDYWLLVKGDDVATFVSDLRGVVDAYKKVFGNKGAVGNFGLGQIAKYYKVGTIEHIDFCSQNVIKTDQGYKVIRKLLNLVDKEHYSVKGAHLSQKQLERYNYDIYESMTHWSGGCQLITDYFNCIYAKRAKHAIKTKKNIKQRFESLIDTSNREYLDRIKSYEEHLKQDERVTQTKLTNEELVDWLYRINDEDVFKAYNTIFDRAMANLW